MSTATSIRQWLRAVRCPASRHTMVLPQLRRRVSVRRNQPLQHPGLRQRGQYITHDTDGSKDAVLKSGFSIQKIVSTTGPGSPAPKLEGAGFTVYRIWELSKVDEFQKNADGTYNVQSILDAYRKDSYDNNTAKYDFTGEGAAVARMYESDQPGGGIQCQSDRRTDCERSGRRLGADRGGKRVHSLGDFHQRGRHHSCDRPAVWPVSGRGNNFAQRLVPGRPVCGHGGFSCPAERPVPAGRQCNHAQQFLHDLQCAERELEGYLQLIKIDAETGKPVKISDAASKSTIGGRDGD